MNIGSKLPWKVSVALAVVVFVVLHVVATMTATPVKGTALTDLGVVYRHTLIHTLAQLLQFIIPAGFLFGAIVSFITQKRAALPPGNGAVAVGVEAPACPRCGSAMVKRVAKQGKNAGKSFWGCSTYPKCSGIRNLL